MKNSILIIIIIATLFCACRKPVIYPDTPEILDGKLEKYLYTLNDEIYEGAKLIFGFKDGDGDIGLNEEDISPPYDDPKNFNLFIDYYEKQNGEFIIIDRELNNNGDTVLFSLNARIPRLSTQLKEPIDGEITHFIPNYFPKTSKSDTMKLVFYIVDRKLNKSNVLETEMIR
ncbi:MAG: hypothetical protein LBI45_00265 [Bacteroidales bacterium]|jgi:hypothetical protein|nr:hypothetical protein [Bacteroidales bacterium]